MEGDEKQMLADECANVSLEITKEGFLVAGELIKEIIPLGGRALSGVMKPIFKKASDIKGESDVKGEVSFDDMLKISQDDKVINIDLSNPDAALTLENQYIRDDLNKKMEQAGILYSINKTRDAEGKEKYDIFFREKDVYKAQQVFKNWEIDMTEYIAFSKLYGGEQANNINWEMVDLLTQEQKEAVKEKWGKCFENLFQNDLSVNDKVYEEAWKDSYFQAETENIFESKEYKNKARFGVSQQEYLVKKIRSSISKDRIVEYKGKNLIYIDDNNMFHHINYSAGTHQKTECKSITEAIAVMEQTNKKLEKFELDLKGKYSEEKGFNELQRRFLYNCMIDSLKNEKIDITYYDKANFSIDKMAALYECQINMSKENAYVVLKQAEDLNVDILWEIQQFSEKQFPGFSIGEILDNRMDREEISFLFQQMKETGYKEMFETEKYNELFEGKFQNTIEQHGNKMIIEKDVSEKVNEVNNKILDLNEEIKEKIIQIERCEDNIKKTEAMLERYTDDLSMGIQISENLMGLDAHKNSWCKELENLKEKKERLVDFKRDYQVYKYVKEKKATVPSIHEMIEVALATREKEQGKVEGILDNSYKKNNVVNMNEILMELQIEKAIRYYHNEIDTVIEGLMDEQEIGLEKDFSHQPVIAEGNKFNFYRTPNGNIKVEMKGEKIDIDKKTLEKWNRSKNIIKNGTDEYRLMMENEKGKLYMDKYGKSIIKMNKELNMQDIQNAYAKMKKMNVIGMQRINDIPRD